MGKPDALARFVLGSRPAEELKNALMILGIDAAAVIGNLEDGEAELGPSPNGDFGLEPAA